MQRELLNWKKDLKKLKCRRERQIENIKNMVKKCEEQSEKVQHMSNQSYRGGRKGGSQLEI